MKNFRKILLAIALLLVVVPCAAIFASCGCTWTLSEGEAYVVTFEDWDGTEIDIQTIGEGEDVVVPADPTRIGYTFAGWDADYTDITADITVTATYTINQYTITFDSNEGSAVTAITQNYATSVTAPAEPTAARRHAPRCRRHRPGCRRPCWPGAGPWHCAATGPRPPPGWWPCR